MIANASSGGVAADEVHVADDAREHEREHAPQLVPARGADALEIDDPEHEDAERPIEAHRAPRLLFQPPLVVAVGVGAEHLVLDRARPRALVEQGVRERAAGPVGDEAEAIERGGRQLEERQAAHREAAEQRALAIEHGRRHEERRVAQVVERRHVGEVADAGRPPALDGEPGQSVVRPGAPRGTAAAPPRPGASARRRPPDRPGRRRPAGGGAPCRAPRGRGDRRRARPASASRRRARRATSSLPPRAARARASSRPRP